MRIGKYEFGRTLGEGNFGKVKYAENVDSGEGFAVKIFEKQKILQLNISEQIKREIRTLRLLRHPNVVRLYEGFVVPLFPDQPVGYTKGDMVDASVWTEISSHPITSITAKELVLASKTKIYMVLEYVTGGDLFDKIVSQVKLKERDALKIFQQLIDGVSYCHDNGVFHRDLKLDNILVDENGNIKISDFGFSALPQQLRDDGLLHTTCGSPNYVAPEVLSSRGYEGATSDIWSCGVILYVILTGCLPFDDRNLAVLYQKIFKGDVVIPKWLSPGAQQMIRRVLDPNPKTRITAAEIKEATWFRQCYVPATPDEDDEGERWSRTCDIDDTSLLSESEKGKMKNPSTFINAFELIGMSNSLDLSGFFEKEDASERKVRFTSNYSAKDLLEKIENVVTQMGFQAQKRNGKLKLVQMHKEDLKNSLPLWVWTEVFEVNPSLHVVELKKSYGDPQLYRKLCTKLSNVLGGDQRPTKLESINLSL